MGLRDWYRKRKRAVCLGNMGHSCLWFDPKTDDIWQASGRWSLFTVASNNDSVEKAIKMLAHVHLCELYVDPDDYGVSV